jgi:hypothetical protein
MSGVARAVSETSPSVHGPPQAQPEYPVSKHRHRKAAGRKWPDGGVHSKGVKLKALQDAARTGFADLDEGRFRDVADGDLDAAMGDLGRRAAARAHDADH